MRIDGKRKIRMKLMPDAYTVRDFTFKTWRVKNEFDVKNV
jgi:hypothetical protein